MEDFIEPGTEVKGNSEIFPLVKCCFTQDGEELSEQKNKQKNGYSHTGLQNQNENAENSNTMSKQTSHEILQHDEIKTRLQEETKENTYTNTKMENGMVGYASHQLQSREMEFKLQHSEEQTDSGIGFQCDMNKSERRKRGMMLRNDGTPTSEGGNENKCLPERESERDVETQCIDKTLQDATPRREIQDGTTTVTGKLENTSHEKENSKYSLRKQVQELEMKIKCITEEGKKEKREMQQSYDEAFLKVVGNNKRMHENLKEIQEHVRREKIESERTKNEVEQVLQERQKLIDQITELTKGFESMIGERDRMESIIETSISAFDSKLNAKDAEIRDLQETIDNDRKQFMEEREEYLTVIESLKAQLQIQEEHMIYCKGI